MSNILKFCIEKGILLDKETFDFFSQFDDHTVKDIINKFALLKERVINKTSMTKHISKIQNLIEDKKVVEKIKVNFGVSFEITRERYVDKKKEELEKKPEPENELGNIRVLMSAPNISKKIEPMDFVHYFRLRYGAIKSIIKERKDLTNLVSIDKLTDKRQSVSVVGIVFKKMISKNKNIMLDIEDLTGRIRVLVNKDKKDLFEKAKNIVHDDIICVRGFGDKEIIFSNDVVFPDSHLTEKTRIDRDESVAFISDIHVGSKNFLEENFLKFIKWINGETGDEAQRKEALKVKYLMVTGDSVDGVGIFPGQQEQLAIEDMYEQYEKLASLLKMIRKDIKIVMCPGQHDSVRVAEPQPPIGSDYAPALHELDNIIFVSNPAMIEIKNDHGKKGFKIFMYHGASMTPLSNEIESLRTANPHHHPAKVVKELLRRRHVNSIHSGGIYIPNTKKDYLVISEVPDVMNTADFHRTDVDQYNGTTIVCSSCWQSITPFEEKVGNLPDPCKVPIINLKSGSMKILDFT